MRLQLHHLHGAGDASDASTPIWFSSRFCFFRIWSQKWAHRGPVTSILTNSKFEISKIKFSKFQITRPGFHFEVPKNIKLRQTQFHMKDTGKSSSRKLRRVIYYALYRMDPQNAHYKISFFAKISKIKNWGKNVYIPPLTPDQPPLKGGRYVIFPLTPDQPPFKGGRYV